MFNLLDVTRADGSLVSVTAEADVDTSRLVQKILTEPGVFGQYGFADDPLRPGQPTINGDRATWVLTPIQAMVLHHEAGRPLHRDSGGGPIQTALEPVYLGSR